MVLDSEQQRALLAQSLDHAARSAVSGANDESLQQVALLAQLRTAVIRASVQAAVVETPDRPEGDG